MSKKFAEGMNLYKLIWVFAIFAIFGTIYEEILFVGDHLIFEGEWGWEPRSGVFWGPFSPIYGVGAVLMLYPLTKWRTFKPWQTFFLSGLIGGVFEFTASWFQEWLMNTRSWDYRDHFINFNGRTSLWVMVIWGLLGVLLVHVLWPPISRWIESWSPKIGKRLTIVLAIFLVLDCGITIFALIRQNYRIQGYPANDPVSNFCDRVFTDEYIHRKIPNIHRTN